MKKLQWDGSFGRNSRGGGDQEGKLDARSNVELRTSNFELTSTLRIGYRVFALCSTSRQYVAPRWESASSQNSATSGWRSSAAWTMPR